MSYAISRALFYGHTPAVLAVDPAKLSDELSFDGTYSTAWLNVDCFMPCELRTQPDDRLTLDDHRRALNLGKVVVGTSARDIEALLREFLALST